ncbi:MAG: hypothetical protein ACYTG0_43195 [Planctomycetota bacterium]
MCERRITRLEASLHGTCDSWQCRNEGRLQRRTRRKKYEEDLRRRQEEFQKWVRQYRNGVARSQGIEEPERFAPVAIPAADRPIVPLPPERRAAFRDHLLELIAEAREKLAAPDDQPDDSETAVPEADVEPSLLPILGRACATCEGHCCFGGGDTAFLDVAAILRYRRRHPDIEWDEIPDAFLAHVAEATYENSCVNHGPKGCTLPRSMRAAICNTFLCTGLELLIGACTGPGPHRVFLVARNRERVFRNAFLEF